MRRTACHIYGHGKKGIIGSTLKPETVKVWSLSLHICSRLEADLTEMSSANLVDTNEKHKEEKQGRINADAKDKASIRRKLTECIDPLDASKHPHSLVSNVTVTMAPSSVYVDKSIDFGKAQMIEFQNSWPENFNRSISKKVETHVVSRKNIRVAYTKVYDINLIYSRMIGLQASSWETDIKHTLNHEWAQVPTAMFTDTGELRKGKTKSVLKNQLK
ncbi:hypothetical protein DPMN_053443 [Dreissena polymorpha]|uniref:Uncharacterized protein n=1 Tax=Dreissena polymorpha TaxID=45954 RepID=A0A9D4CLC5_DREPO|nr:hypothetical protein DPMN_053443 [Dreissena polymorpha]